MGGHMFDMMLSWLNRRQARWHVANTILVTAILALCRTDEMKYAIGISALLFFAVIGFGAARTATRCLPFSPHPFEVFSLWWPGAIALLIALAGLWLAIEARMPQIGLPAFALQVSLLAWTAADQATRKNRPDLKKRDER